LEEREAELVVPPETSDEPELDAPLLLYCVFGLPVFLTVLWFFLQFTRPDRFGRVDRAAIDEPDEPGPPGAGPDEGAADDKP